MNNLLPILQKVEPSPDQSPYQAPNDPDGGALVIDSQGDCILHVQKPKNVFIPRVDITTPSGSDITTTVNNFIEHLLWAAVLQQDTLTSVPENRVLEALSLQLPDNVVWLLANTQLAVDTAAKIAAKFRASKSGPMEMMQISGGPPGQDIIIGTTNPAGFYLEPSKPYIVKGELECEVTPGHGWLVYPGRVAAVKLTKKPV